MYLLFKEFHSYVAFLLLAVLVVVIAMGIYGWVARKPFSKVTRILSLVGLGAVAVYYWFSAVLFVAIGYE